MTSVIFFGLKFFVKFVFEIKIIFFWNFFENPLKFNQKPLETHSHGFLSCARLTAQYHLRQRQKSRFDTLVDLGFLDLIVEITPRVGRGMWGGPHPRENR